MSKSFLKGMLCGLLSGLAVSGTAVGIIYFSSDNVGTDDKSTSIIKSEAFQHKFNSIERYINTYYLDADKVDDKTISNGMYQGLLDSLGDKYADYYDTDEYASTMEKNYGQYGGIGSYVSVNTETGDIVLVNPFEGGPADKAGIKPGDVLVEIDGTSVVGMELDDVVAMMKGKEGTEVKVKIYRNKELKDIAITREIVDVPTVGHEILKESNLGYIYVSAFDNVTASQFEEAIDDVEAKNTDGLIIDLRNNGGGMLDSAISMLDRILPEGLVLYTETKNGRDEEFFSTADKSYDKPFAILINQYSASASEVFSGAVQDFGTGTLVGTKSFGKGIIQTIFPLRDINDGSAIKITTAKYFTPKGRNIDGTGITPDFEVEYDPDKTVEKDGLNYDNQLMKAIEVVKEKLQK